MIKAVVTSCKKDSWWYSNKVGKEFEVVSVEDNDVRVSFNGSDGFLINKDDCDLFEIEDRCCSCCGIEEFNPVLAYVITFEDSNGEWITDNICELHQMIDSALHLSKEFNISKEVMSQEEFDSYDEWEAQYTQN